MSTTGVESASEIRPFHVEIDRGGHFAAWEDPELFAEEMRAAFTSRR